MESFTDTFSIGWFRERAISSIVRDSEERSCNSKSRLLESGFSLIKFTDHFISFNKSSAEVTNIASRFLIRLFVPWETTDVAGPGIANNCFLYFFAKLAVIRLPELGAASITKTAWASAAIILFLLGNIQSWGEVLLGYSLKIKPLFSISE